MAYIKKKSERKFKITVCNGYKVNGQKRMKAQTITVPSSVPKRGIQQYVICCRKAPANRWRHLCWVMRIRHFWSAPTATRRTWRSVRRQT